MDYFIFGECMSCFIDFIDINLWEKYTLTNLVSEADFGKVLPGSRLYSYPPLRRGRRIFGNQLQPARIPADACRHQGGQDQARCR